MPRSVTQVAEQLKNINILAFFFIRLMRFYSNKNDFTFFSHTHEPELLGGNIPPFDNNYNDKE